MMRTLAVRPRARLGLANLRWLAGTLALLAAWELLAVLLLAKRHEVPTIQAVAAQIWRDHFYGPDLAVTLWEALRGYLIGNGLAVLLGVLCLLVRPLERILLRFAVATYCIPTIAVGPLLAILFSLDTTKVVMSALSVFFVSLVGILTGLHDAPPSALDVVHANGGGRWAALVKVRVRAAVPSAFSGLAIAGPAAVLGAIIGEFLGGTSGLGVVMVNSEASLEVARTWGVAIIATAVSGIVFAVTLWIGRVLAPGFAGSEVGRQREARSRLAPPASWSRPARIAAAVGARIGSIMLTLVIILAVWAAIVKGFHLDPYFAKTPLAVWTSLTSPLTGPTERSELWSGFGVTLRDAAIGYLLGTAAAVILAGAFILWPIVQAAFMPIVVVLRAVPLVAMTPLLALVFGTGIGVVAAVAGIVAFVPSVVIVYEGLRSPPPTTLDLLHAYGASSPAVLWRLRLPYALPALFAAAKIAVPGAALGAALAEWLVASDGLGRDMALAVTESNFQILWAATALVTALSAVAYNLLSASEQGARARLGR